MSQTTRPDNIINPTELQWDQSPSKPTYLKLVMIYDLEEGEYKRWRVSTGPTGVVYTFAGTIIGPDYHYETVNFLQLTSGILLSR